MGLSYCAYFVLLGLTDFFHNVSKFRYHNYRVGQNRLGCSYSMDRVMVLREGIGFIILGSVPEGDSEIEESKKQCLLCLPGVELLDSPDIFKVVVIC